MNQISSTTIVVLAGIAWLLCVTDKCRLPSDTRLYQAGTRVALLLLLHHLRNVILVDSSHSRHELRSKAPTLPHGTRPPNVVSTTLTSSQLLVNVVKYTALTHCVNTLKSHPEHNLKNRITHTFAPSKATQWFPLNQGSQTGGPRAICGPHIPFIWPAPDGGMVI